MRLREPSISRIEPPATVSHSRDDERLRGHMIDEKQHPGAERFKWWQGSRKSLLRCGELFDFTAVDGLDEGVASRKVAIEGGIPDARPAGDVVKARICAIPGEDVLGYLQDAFAITLRIRAGFAGRLEWRKLLLRHIEKSTEIFCIRGVSPFIY